MPRKGYKSTPKYKEHAKRAQKARRAERLAILAALKNVPCADCLGKFPSVCMDFDHRPGEAKVADLTKMVSFSLTKIMAEVAKCDVVCANCHRVRTALRNNWTLHN